MTYIYLNEEAQTFSYPPINKDNICNYNLSLDLLKSDGYVDIDDNLISLLSQHKAIIKNKKIVNITGTDDYKSKIATQEKTAKIADLNARIDAVDKKRIRAICEPSVKDETTGQTWLEYYNLQVQELRTQINELG